MGVRRQSELAALLADLDSSPTPPALLLADAASTATTRTSDSQYITIQLVIPYNVASIAEHMWLSIRKTMSLTITDAQETERSHSLDLSAWVPFVTGEINEIGIPN